jgi:apolipoprotein D and lipocalin family protein
MNLVLPYPIDTQVVHCLDLEHCLFETSNRIILERLLMKIIAVLVTLLSLTGCLGMPEKVKPVQSFELNRYLGKWYEIARLDHSFERGMEQVSAEYTLKENGKVAVLNRGFVTKTGQWKDAEGKAYFVNKKEEGYLKVSFFGPFYGSYVIFELDQNYEYAFVSGPDTSYLWLLARKPHIAPEIIERFKTRAKELGFKTENLIFVKHP